MAAKKNEKPELKPAPATVVKLMREIAALEARKARTVGPIDAQLGAKVKQAQALLARAKVPGFEYEENILAIDPGGESTAYAQLLKAFADFVGKPVPEDLRQQFTKVGKPKVVYRGPMFKAAKSAGAAPKKRAA